MSRKYQAAWEQLKRDGFIRIAAHKLVHKRIVKAIVKEKNIDLVYKYVLAEDCKHAIISHKRNSGELLLFLKISIGLSDL